MSPWINRIVLLKIRRMDEEGMIIAPWIRPSIKYRRYCLLLSEEAAFGSLGAPPAPPPVCAR